MGSRVYIKDRAVCTRSDMGKHALVMDIQKDHVFFPRSNTKVRERSRGRQDPLATGGAGIRSRHGSNRGDKLQVGEEHVQRWRGSAWMSVALGSPPTLAGDRSGGARRGSGVSGASRRHYAP